MEVKEVTQAINKRVHYVNNRRFVNADFIFTAYIYRKIGDKVLHQAELQDIKSQRSVLIVPLEDVAIQEV